MAGRDRSSIAEQSQRGLDAESVPPRSKHSKRLGGPFEFFAMWTRTQRIRTAAGMPVEAVIIDQTELPVYLRIAEKAKRLRELGMSDRAIARSLGVSDKTVAKAVDWHAACCSD